jgi:hypothetical protein
MQVFLAGVQTTALGVYPNLETFVIEHLDPRAVSEGLRLGDRVDLTDMPYAVRERYFDFMAPSMPVGMHRTIHVIRDGVRYTFRLHWLAVPADPPGVIVYNCLNLLILTLFFVTGACLVLMRPSAMMWGFYLFCIGLPTSFVSGLLGNPSIAAIVVVAACALRSLGFAGLLIFAARFPRDRAESGWQKLERFAVVVLSSLPCPYTPSFRSQRAYPFAT